MATIDNSSQGFFLHYSALDFSGGLYAAYLYADSEDMTVTIEIGSIVWTAAQGPLWASGQANAIANRLNALDPREHFFYVIFGNSTADGYNFTFQQEEDFNFRIGTPSSPGDVTPLDPPAAPYPEPIPHDAEALIRKRKSEVPVANAAHGGSESGAIPTSAKRPKRVIA
jgi:hypothetical protein